MSHRTTEVHWTDGEVDMIKKIFYFWNSSFIVHGNESRNTVIMRSTDVVLVFILKSKKMRVSVTATILI